MTKHRPAFAGALVVAIGLLLADGSRAGQAVAPSFSVPPVLVKCSGGAFVDFQLDRRAVKRRISIAGRAARVRTIGNTSAAAYQASVTDSSLRSGRTYRVSIKVVSASGGSASRVESLLLRPSFPRR